jgi:hypothetical protein
MKIRAKASVRALKLSAAALLIASSLTAHASPEMDRRYSLQTVGVLRSSDNVDGLFSDYVARAIRDYFDTQPRFVLQDLASAQSLIDNSKVPYSKVIEDQKILEKLARGTRSETLLRTRIFKEGPRYRFTVDWLHSPKMDVLSTEVFYLDEPSNGNTLGAETIRSQFQSALDRLIAKIPFYAHLTGRDGETVTINSGENLGLKKGDTLWVGTIEDVKKHPLLGVIAEWKISRTGSVLVESVDHALAFGRITEEDPARPIARGQKVIQVIKAPDPVVNAINDNPAEKAPIFDRTDAPRVGWVSAAPLFGEFSRQFSSQSGVSGKAGTGLFFGARADTLLWLDREWFAEGTIGYGYFPYSQSSIVDGSTTNISASGSLTTFKLSLGYSYLPGLNFFGAKGWIKAGYHSYAYTLPKRTSENINPVSWSGMLLGIGGDLPLRGDWAAQLNLDFGLLRTVQETGTARAAALGSTLVDFYFGTVYTMRPRLLFRLGVNFQAQGADFEGGSSLSHRAITLMPSFVVPF